MVQAKRVFRGRLTWCQKNQEQIIMDKIASHLSGSDFGKLWKSTNRLHGSHGLPLSVDGVSRELDIADTFKQHFAVKPPLGPSQGVPGAEASRGQVVTLIKAKDIRIAISRIKRGKSPGHDGLSIEHIKDAEAHIARVLALLFDLCLAHSYLPFDLMRTIVVPVIKNRTGDVADKSNYRPISLATVVAKVLDGVLNSYLNPYLHLYDAQFGFQPGLSTESAIVTLKHTVKYYTDRKTPIFAKHAKMGGFGLIMTSYGLN
ncbi:uncharacterized protein LOC113226210 [Hyposmocoma kahamanoa]|uniref:uncharacterized protein LOC113226210 n=1 Tax=Hyposmocoma kahamanoa TaxID=1477025 RepID=UPI000E6D9486|nr:uncharacterized protein LOC113226210 [Hyposmocoma kahamanoa]